MSFELRACTGGVRALLPAAFLKCASSLLAQGFGLATPEPPLDLIKIKKASLPVQRPRDSVVRVNMHDMRRKIDHNYYS
jgi:hypothetical protein